MLSMGEWSTRNLIFDANNEECVTLCRSLDARKELTAAGFGTEVNCADPVTPDMATVF